MLFVVCIVRLFVCEKVWLGFFGPRGEGWNYRMVVDLIVVSGAVAERLSWSWSYPDFRTQGAPDQSITITITDSAWVSRG